METSHSKSLPSLVLTFLDSYFLEQSKDKFQQNKAHQTWSQELDDGIGVKTLLYSYYCYTLLLYHPWIELLKLLEVLATWIDLRTLPESFCCGHVSRKTIIKPWKHVNSFYFLHFCEKPRDRFVTTRHSLFCLSGTKYIHGFLTKWINNHCNDTPWLSNQHFLHTGTRNSVLSWLNK